MDALTYSISHDLMAPVRHIAGFADILPELDSVRSDPEATDVAHRIRGASLRLDRMIRGLLSLSRICRAEMQRQSMSLADLIKDLKPATPVGAPRPVLALELGPLPDIEADPAMMQAVLQQLLDNAVKFSRQTPQPRITIRASIHDAELWVCVEDNGVGFSSTHQARLFQPFGKLHAETEFEGPGIGLAVVKRIIERHSGRVWAESDPGRGARFFLALPLGTSEGC